MLYVGIRGVEPPGWAAAEIDVCGLDLQDGQARPQPWGAAKPGAGGVLAVPPLLGQNNCRGRPEITKSL